MDPVACRCRSDGGGTVVTDDSDRRGDVIGVAIENIRPDLSPCIGAVGGDADNCCKPGGFFELGSCAADLKRGVCAVIAVVAGYDSNQASRL